jgi:uncharacterized protein YuzE
MRVELDEEAGDAYIYLTKIGPSEAKHSCPVECAEVRGEIILDLNAQGQLIGIEVLGARSAPTSDVLDAAQRIGFRSIKHPVQHGSRHRRGKPR